MGVCGGRSATRHQQVVAKLPPLNSHLSSSNSGGSSGSSSSGSTSGGQQQRTTSSGLLLSDIIEGSCSSNGNSHMCESLNIESANCSKNPHPHPHHRNLETHSGQNQLLPSFVNCSDESIFTLASNSQMDSIHQLQQQNLQDNSIYMLAQEVNGVGNLNSINSSLANNNNNNKSNSNSVVAEQFGGSSNFNHNHHQQQQHRRLQHQVHQQLQQIYGNAGRQAQRLAANQIGSRQVEARQSSQQQQQQQQKRFIDNHQTNSSQRDEQLMEFSIGENRSKLQQRGRQHQKHSMTMFNQQEQIYDPLVGLAGVISRGYNKIDQQQQQQPSETTSYYGQNIHQHICSIPEESNDEEDELLLPGTNNNSASSSSAVSSSSSKMVAINRRRNHLEDLHYATVTAAALLSATANAAAALASTGCGGGGGGDRNVNCSSKQRHTKTAATARDNQTKKVETPGDNSSHASLAAPSHHQQQSATKITTTTTTARNERANASIYSEAYQEVSNSADRRQRDDIETRVVNQTKWYRQQPEQQQQNRVYSDVMDSNNMIQQRSHEISHLQHHQIRQNASAATDAIYGTRINSKVIANPNYTPNNNRVYQQQQQHQQTAAKLLVNYAGLVRPPQPPPNRRPPPQFAAVANANANGTEMLIRQPHLNDQYRLYLRQQHQQQQQQRALVEMGLQMLPGQAFAAAAAAAAAANARTTPVVPAHTFAIFQKPPSNRNRKQSPITDQASIRADLINRLLIANNHHHHQRVNAAAFVNTDNNNNNNLNAAAVVSAHYAQQHYAMLGNKLRTISNETHKQNLFPGHLIEQKNGKGVGGGGGDKLYVAAIPHQRAHQHHSSIFPMAPPPAAALLAAPSSNSSVVPLVLDRNIRPPGFIERICQIDLKLFWWSLLIVCFFFIGIIITISRYVF